MAESAGSSGAGGRVTGGPLARGSGALRWLSDARRSILEIFAPGPIEVAVLDRLLSTLVTDCYGNQPALAIAAGACNRRHSVHLMRRNPATGGELWCGGIAAGGDAEFTRNNGIRSTLAAASYPLLARDKRIKHLGTYDGSGLLVGHWPWETVLQVMDSVVEELDKGSRAGRTVFGRQRPTGPGGPWQLSSLEGRWPLEPSILEASLCSETSFRECADAWREASVSFVRFF